MKLNKLLLALVASGMATSVFATNGYFSHGYGMNAKGMAGAATAMTGDAFGGANNPATMVWAGNRWDAGIDAFSPQRSATTAGETAAGTGTNKSQASANELFGVPEFGYNKMLNDKMSLGVTVYGNGGMNTDYAFTGSMNQLMGSTALGVDLSQLIIAPTLSYKASDTMSIGVSPLIGYQRFEAYGLGAFSGYSNSSAHLTNNGTDEASGFGVRVGAYARLSDQVSVGAAYSTKINMSKFDKYKGLFAEQGDFDVPANWNVGVALKANAKTTIALDYQHIAYSDVKSVGNPSTNLTGLAGGAGYLGKDQGAGFGWSDVDVVKLGVEYAYAPDTTIRAGYSHTDSPIQARDVSFNVLAPAVIEDHITLGLTKRLDKSSEITVSYAHAVENTLSGTHLFGSTYGTQTVKMDQNSIGIAYSKKF